HAGDDQERTAAEDRRAVDTGEGGTMNIARTVAEMSGSASLPTLHSLSPDGFIVGGEGWGEGVASESIDAAESRNVFNRENQNAFSSGHAAPSPNPLPHRNRWAR